MSIILQQISRLDIIEDAGKSLSPEIDLGQIEGALVMGLGLWTEEKIIFHPETGRLLTRNTWVRRQFLLNNMSSH